MIKPEGMTVLETLLPPREAIERFRSAVEASGMKVFALIDFAADARNAGLTMGDAVLLVFGNPRVGTLLLIDAPHAGIDLPLKALAWTHQGKQWLSYNEPAYIARRHGLSMAGPIQKMSDALKHAATAVLGNEVS
ncbi:MULTISPECIES: DUF302 domain-containing protein [unclassified Rhizobium]|uniref:DUF302 domain-containing protein n=1 Tax=unclassified Rhizobium TaxID=2613769 RepID=UPI001ADAF0C7|nr:MULTISPECIES: DUF302 domain-containing protein [unclassified Rhizobium]MBO9128043.1 DUF302 domain-containing protein [Rhizobium sp. 16-488-2b]MBO9178577.1 DUF302 domain-containing protein [Rhizobium sp. 16-488-2a]